MSLSHGPSIATSGLVFAYDIGNTQKSWKGAPITNVQWNNGSEITPWTVGGQNNDVSSTIGLAAPIPQAKTWEFIKTGTSNQWNGWENSYGGIWTGSSGDYWSVSYWYKTEAPAGASAFGVGSFFTSDWSRAYNTTVIDNVSSIIADGNWHYNYTVVRFNENYSNAIIVDGPSWSYSTSSGLLYINGLCWNKNSYAAPWAAGTRSTTQALVDIVGKNTLTTSSLTYNSDGTFSFNGSTNYMTVSNTGITHGSSDWTYTMWANWSSITSLGTIYENGSWANSLLLRFETSGFSVYSMGTYWGFLSFTPTLNTWYHLAFIRSGTTVYLYINGVLTATITSFTATIVPNTSLIYIGMSQHAAGQCFNGKLNNGSIYTIALSSAEILRNFNALRGRYGI